MSLKKEHKWKTGDNPNRFHHPEWQFDQLDCLRFYLDEYGSFPNSSEWKSDNTLSLDLMIDYLNDNDFKVVQQRNFSAGIRQIVFYRDGELVNIYSFAKSVSNFTNLPESILSNKTKNDKIIVCGRFDVLHKGLEKPEFMNELVKHSTLNNNSDKPIISIISRDSHGFKLVHNTLDIEYNENLELHYGSGFNKFHNTLINKLNNSHKGIVIFHGDPGTGKTYYIKNLLFDLVKTKQVILLPNATVNYLMDPEFTDFILELVDELNCSDDEWADDADDEIENISNGKSIVLVIEDAEPVLMKRDDTFGSNQGTSNILNMTDGIMNDIFGFQVIATFNTDIKNIDPAVLRSQRLVARKTFNKLSVEDSQNLINHLKVNYQATEPMSVADIYSMKEKGDNDVLIEEVKSSTPKIGI